MRLGFVVTAALLLSAPSARALDPRKAVTQYGRDVWQVEQGLPQHSVFALAQAADGYLWFGTAEGLVRFDGARFVVFDRRNTPAIANNVITALLPGADGALWIGTDAGLVRLREGAFLAVPNVQGRVTALLEEPAGTLWVGISEGGAVRLPTGEPAATPEPLPGLPSASVRDLARGEHGAVFVATEGAGIAEVRAGVIARVLGREDGLPSLRVKSLASDKKGGLWIGTYDAGLAVRAAGGGARVTEVKVPEGARHVARLLVDRQGTVWMGTTGAGVVRFAGGAPQVLRSREGLVDDHVVALAEDAEGSVWMGTLGGGLVRLRDGRFTPYSMPEGLPHQMVRTIAEDRAGTIWIGTEGGGLAAIDEGRVTRILGTREGLAGDRVYAIAESADGTLWIGTTQGLSRIRGGHVATYAADDGRLSSGVHNIAVAPDGTLWLGTFRDGLVRFEPGPDTGGRLTGRLTAFTTREGLVSNTVLALTLGRDGGVWVGTAGGGLSRLEGGRLTSITARDGLPSGFVYALHEDASGALWIGTFGGGLVRLKGGRLSVLGTREGLLDDVVYGLVEDEAGDFWLTSNRGIFRVSRAELDAVADGRRARVTTHAYDLSDGLRSVECNSGGQPATRARDGGLWFATVKGAVRVDRTRLEPSLFQPPVLVEQTVVAGTAQTGTGPHRLPADSERFEFHYTALGLRAPARLRFRYRLEGLDDEWVEAGARRVAYYNRVPHGRYTFRVQASNEDGVWSGQTATVSLAVAPHVYETRWFLILALGAAGLAVYGAHRARLRRAELRTAEMEAMVGRRTAELRESEARALSAQEEAEQASRAKSAFVARMSHELRTPLNIILGFVQLLEQEPARGAADRERLSLIGRSGEHLLRLINDVLSLAKIESGRLTFDEAVFDPAVLLRDLEMFQVAAARKGLALEIDVVPGWPPAVRGDEGKLRQVLINLLGNAVKFTARGRVRLRAQWREGHATLEVDDTGPGIAPGERAALFESFSQTESGRRSREGTGLGLAISRTFVRVMGGTIEALEAPEGGARFRVEVPLPAAEALARFPEPTGERLVLAPGQAVGRILVVDDTALNRRLLRQILEGMGFEVDEAADGGEGVERWAAARPALVWMDIRMDLMDGYEATRAIRRREAQEGRAPTKVIALTASAMEDDRAAILQAGADDVVAKPFRVATIASVLARHLGVRLVPRDGEGGSEPRPAIPSAGAAGLPAVPSLAHLPAGWTDDLHGAILRGDVQAAYRVVEQIRAEDAEAADGLRGMIRAYRFEEVLALTARATSA